MKTSGLRKKAKKQNTLKKANNDLKRGNISPAEFNKIKKGISTSFKQMTKK